jgi:hypothetical protein
MGPQGFGCLGRGLDVSDVGVQGSGRRDHDRKGAEVRKRHSYEGVEMNPVERPLTLMRRPL